MKLPTKSEVESEFKRQGYIDIHTPDALIWITPRPHYCDRGTYLVNCEAKGLDISVDGADMFPHYYFGFEAMMSEIEAWCRKRRQWEDRIKCPKCKMVSYNPNDIKEKYCGNCHQFHEFLVL